MTYKNSYDIEPGASYIYSLAKPGSGLSHNAISTVYKGANGNGPWQSNGSIPVSIKENLYLIFVEKIETKIRTFYVFLYGERFVCLTEVDMFYVLPTQAIQ